MDTSTSKKLLTETHSLLSELKYNDFDQLNVIREKLKLYIEKTFGTSSRYKSTLNQISLYPIISYGGMPDSEYRKSWESGKRRILTLIDTMVEDIELSNLDFPDNPSSTSLNSHSKNVFIVHGHNEEMKSMVARVIEKLSLNPVILHEQANKGRTIIEKFTDHSDVGFAIVLLSADDVAHSINEKPEDSKLRARQNVILELGYFLGRLGRDKVVALVQQVDNFEFPSDYQGVIYIPYDINESWKFHLAKELKASGYNITVEALL